MTTAVADVSLERRRRSLAGNAGFALAGDLVSKASQLVVTLVAARTLPVHEVALLGIALACSTLLASAFDAGFSLIISRDGAAGRDARSLAAATIRLRAPFAALATVLATAVGVATGCLGDALACLALALTGALALSLLGVFRAEQDLAYEAAYKLAAGIVSMGAALTFLLATRTAAGALLGLLLGPVVVLPLFGARMFTRSHFEEAGRRRALAGSALPFGALALATLAYYRLPTLLLGALTSPRVVATYTVAAAIGFGTLALANAITTGLLPRLAAVDEALRPLIAREALEWTVRISVWVAALGLAFGLPLIRFGFGSRYENAFTPVAILLVAGVLIGASGVLGTALTAAGATRALVRQVAYALIANVALVAVLAPRYGADGAAAATLLTELLALVLLATSVSGLVHLPSRGSLARAIAASASLALAIELPAPGRVAAACGAAVVILPRPLAVPRAFAWAGGCLVFAALDIYAITTSYGMRVISDTPTYLAIIPRLAETPLHPISVFMRAPSVDDPHATPYMQGVALLWRLWNADARPDPIAIERLLNAVGVLVMLFVLHAFYVWVRRQTNARTAYVALPVLLVLFGPGHVIWAGDLTFHGFLYGAYFPQTLAIGLMLWTLVVLDGPPVVWRYLIGTGCVAATFTVHPFTATVLCVLVAASGSAAALAHRRDWQLGSICLALGYIAAAQWPEYSMSRAVGQSGVPPTVLIVGCAAAPLLASSLERGWVRRRARLLGTLERIAGFGSRLAFMGTAVVLGLAAWESWLFTQPSPDPLVHSNHLGLYWVEDRWRWPLMYAAGAVGVAGLCRLALRGRPAPLFFAASCFGVGVAGAAGMNVPLWWRFLLFAQPPLALGAAAWLVEAVPGVARRVATSGLVFNGVFKVATLVLLPTTITYFGSPLQDSYRLGAIVPPAPGAVAADPFTSYFVPGTTGHSVLVVTKAHVASSSELAAADEGYALLHRFYSGSDWWSAAQEMYRRGVRYVLIEKSTSLGPPDLVTFSTGPTPLVRTAADRRALGTYYYRNNRVGRLIYDERPYTLYELSQRKLFGR